jgi:hypothetical protein
MGRSSTLNATIRFLMRSPPNTLKQQQQQQQQQHDTRQLPAGSRHPSLQL